MGNRSSRRHDDKLLSGRFAETSQIETHGTPTKKPAEEENKAGNATTSAGLAATSATGKKGKGATGLTSSTKNGTNFQDKEGKFELLHTRSQKADHTDDEQLVTLIEALTGINIGICKISVMTQTVRLTTIHAASPPPSDINPAGATSFTVDTKTDGKAAEAGLADAAA
ncbi:unnamed protein product [Diplocarpon coronariae]